MWQRIITLAFFLATSSALAQTNAYTKFDFEKNCTIISEYELGVEARCLLYQPLELTINQRHASLAM